MLWRKRLYKIERARIAGLKQPHLYLNGWVHSNNYIITVKVDGKVFTKISGFICRPDVMDLFKEKSHPKRKFNRYGFYGDLKLDVDTQTIELVLDIPEQKFHKTILVKKNYACSRFLATGWQLFKDYLKKLKKIIIKHSYWLQYLRHPQSLRDSKFRQILREIHFNTMSIDVLDPNSIEVYNNWTKKNEVVEKPQQHKHQPKISVLVPVYNPNEQYLKECIDSVLQQTYQNFELCLADDCSTDKGVKTILEQYKKQDKRIKVIYCKKNGGISAATNAALKKATGEFVALLDNDDVLPPQALYENIKAINQHDGKVDFLYSDEDNLNLMNQRLNPHFKQDWSPDTLLSYNYITHFAVLRRSIVNKIGGFNSKYDGAQDFALFLHFTENTTAERIVHIPKILYHWRMSETSTAGLSTQAKQYAIKAGKQALQDTLKRRHITGAKVNVVQKTTLYNVVYKPKAKDMVSIIIPTKDNYKQLRTCLRSIKTKTQQKYEIIIVSNNTSHPKALQYLNSLKNKANITILTINKPFNYSMLNNRAAEKAKGQYLLFLNDDTKAITKNWLEILLGYAEQKHIGAVGAKLLFSNNKVQHIGVTLGLGHLRIAAHCFGCIDRDDIVPQNHITHNHMTVTGACFMVAKEKFWQCGGFDEKLPVDYNDVDLGIALYDKGYFNVCVPAVELYHYESMTRPTASYKAIKSNVAAAEYERQKWGAELFLKDPFYNENFSLHAPFSLKTQKEQK